MRARIVRKGSWDFLVVIVASVGCGSGTLSNAGAGGAAGRGGIGGGAAGRGGAGGIGGAAGDVSTGSGGDFPRAPDTNDPSCRPDVGFYYVDSTVAASGQCTTGVTCMFAVGVSTGCDQAVGLETFVCCPVVFSPPGFYPIPIPHSGYVPGSSLAACPTPLPDQDPACALPLASTCSVEGLQCQYTSAHQCQTYCSTWNSTINCCHGAWQYDACPATDGGTD